MVDASIPFDYYKMHEYLKEIRTYLAELHYIDQVFAYMDKVESNAWETVVDGVLSAGTNGGDDIRVDFAGTVSFSRTWRVPAMHLLWQDSAAEEAREKIAEFKAKASGWASDNMDSVEAMIKPLAHPTGSVYLNDLIQPVRDALARLEDFVSHDFGKLQHSLGRWSGEAADDFATNFYDPFEHTLASHHRMLAALITGLEAGREIVDLTQQSVMNVLKATRDTLLEQLNRRAQQAAATQTKQTEQAINTALILTTAAIPVLKATPETLWESRVDLLGVGASALAGAAKPASMQEHTLTGGTADELLHGLSEAIKIISRNSDRQYDDLDGKVQDTLSRMEFIRDTPDGEDGRLIPRQPRLLNGTDSSEFYLPQTR